MSNKNIYIITGIIVVVLVVFFASKSKVLSPTQENPSEQTSEEAKTSPTATTDSKTPTSSKTSGSISVPTITTTSSSSALPGLDFIDKRIVFPLKNFPDVKITIEKVVFGRGEILESTGCRGIPNADFSTYLYPGSGVCLSSSEIDGQPVGVVAIHMLIENNGNTGFGGTEFFKLQYLRSDSTGKPIYKFADALKGLKEYYLNGYSSKEIILSYLVPEDQLAYNFVSEYKEPDPTTVKSLNVYDYSSDGLFIDFATKTLKIVK